MKDINKMLQDVTEVLNDKEEEIMSRASEVSVFATNEEGRDIKLPLSTMCRHGLIAGATGTGKTVTLKSIAARLSDLGVPCLVTDIKGDLESLIKNAEVAYDTLNAYNNDNGIHTRICEVAPSLLARTLHLTQVQEDHLSIVYRIAKDEDMRLYTINDLREVLDIMSYKREAYRSRYGTIRPDSIDGIKRALLILEDIGGNYFFRESTSTDPLKWISERDGQGIVSILDSTKLVDSPLYSTILIWLLEELYHKLPEVGQLDKPKMILFFDEAHLIFDDASAELLATIERTVRLIRSRGIGIFFCTQSPTDIPESILAQLGMRVQHRLSAYTAKQQADLHKAAKSYRTDGMDVATVIQELGIGEAIISVLDKQGIPTPVQKVHINDYKSSKSIENDKDDEYMTFEERLQYLRSIVAIHPEVLEELQAMEEAVA